MTDKARHEDRIARLRLARSDNIGPVAYQQLVARFGSASAALDAIPALAARGGGPAPRLVARAEAEREMERTAKQGAEYLFAGDPGYPPLLAQLEAPPPALIVKGLLTLLERPAIALVGARNASAAGCRLARQLSAALGMHDVVVVSGLARGIDTAAHMGALDSGTIASVAGGIDVFYPPENEKLQREIGERGLLVSELPCGVEPRSRHFPRRNRIIAGLSLGTVVIEAAPKSGSLITARRAGDYGRDVMAVPGSPLDPRAQGCNLLIREGATLVQSADDILEAMHPFDLGRLAEPGESYASPAPAGDIASDEREKVSGLLGPTPTPVDEIIRQSGLAGAIVQTVLLELELAGRLQRHAGGRVSIDL